ncbi:conjugal transfer protein TraH [Escherichia coli]|nr:conjugal transfer protein TraH [Escherichia coli]
MPGKARFRPLFMLCAALLSVTPAASADVNSVIFRRTHIDAFSGASSAVHTNDRSLTMVDLFCLRRGERQAGIGDGF